MPLSPLHVPGCARLGIARLNAFRLNVYEPNTQVVLGGVNRSANLRIEGASIQHALNDAPDTASFRAHGFTPVAGQPIDVYSGDLSETHALFHGRILETSVVYEGRAQNVAYDLRCIDPTWLFNRRKVLASYTQQSASAIIRDLVTRFARGVTTFGVADRLPVLDAITFTNEDLPQCLTAICERIGGSWSLDAQEDHDDLHVFLSEDTVANPITDANCRTSSDHALAEDLSQVVTKAIGRGGGVGAALDLPAGSTELPVDEGDTVAASWYSETGGLVEVNSDVLTYTGVQGRGAVGAMVGQALSPTAAPYATAMSNTSLGATLPSGVYEYALTFANATGETKAGPVASVTVGGTAPTLNKTTMRPGYYQDYNGKTTGGNYSWRIALRYEGGGYALGPPTDYQIVNDREYEIFVGYAWNDPVSGYLYYTGLMSGTPARIETTYIYRTIDGGNVWHQERFFSGVAYTSGGGWLRTANQMTDADLIYEDTANAGAFRYPTGPIATFNAARIYGFPSLPAGFTTLKLYRTAVGAAQLKLRIANPPTPFDPLWDTAADASLGANAPTSDTSGVVASSTQTVAAGATEIPVTDTGPFTADGGAGWARLGDLAIRYTGIGAGTLTGIPATGVGALTTAVRHGAVLLVQPRLVGIPASGPGAITAAIKKGDTVTIRLELTDTVAATALATRLGSADPEDGIVEDTFSDSRYTLAELQESLEALLLERKDPRLTLTFQSRDPSLQVGRTITISLTSPPIAGTFRIQSIAFSEIAITGGLARVAPLRRVEATNKLFTFADLLRQLRGRRGGVPV